MTVRDDPPTGRPLSEAAPGHAHTGAEPPRDPNRRYGRSPGQPLVHKHTLEPAAPGPEAAQPPSISAPMDKPEPAGSAGKDESRPGRQDEPEFDAEYRRWREEHVRMLDSEYGQWRQERYRQFAQEFSHWRQQRQPQPLAAHSARFEPVAPAKQAPKVLDNNNSALGPVAGAEAWPAQERVQESMERERAGKAYEGGGGGLLSQLLGGGRERHKRAA